MKNYLFPVLLLVSLLFPLSIPAVISSNDVLSKARFIPIDALSDEELAVSQRWYAYVGMRNTYYAKGASAELWIYENDIDSSSRSDFIAFSLTLVRPTALAYDWYEVGYYQDYSGYWFFTATYISGLYQELRHSSVVLVPNSGTHYLKLLEVDEKFIAYVDDKEVDYMSFPSWVSTERIYATQGESSDPTNPLRGHFYNLQYYSNGVWNSWTEILPKQYSPYYARLSSTDAYYSTLLGDINLDYMVDSSDAGELNYYFYDTFWDPMTQQWVYIVGIGGYEARADFNHDGFVNIYDIAQLNVNWHKAW